MRRPRDWDGRAFLYFLLLPVFFAPLGVSGSESVIHVKVEVDFGPKGKKPVKKTVTLPKGSTVVEATKAVAELKQGFVCCDMRDVETIGGVRCDPENEGWWLYDINGEKGPVSAYRYLLEDGDKVTWRYRVFGSLHKAKGSSYQVTNGGAGILEGTVGAQGRIPALPPFLVHKNEIYCGHEARKPNPCSRVHDPGKLSGAVIWLSGVKTGKAWEAFPLPVLTQRNCEFTPHLIVARQGSELKVLSEDSVLHSVHALDEDHRTLFNLAMPNASSKNEVSLVESGVWDIQCDAGHRWMKAHLVVLDNPYWTLTAKDGSWSLEGVPPGDYTLNIWHDLYGLQKREVSVKEGTLKVSTLFPADKFRVDLRYAEVK